jgi:SAM-dependent methyltransferase
MASMAERPLHETQAFFSIRASTWDQKFPDDVPAFARAVAELELRAGSRVLDLGTGTGRAIPRLRQHVGSAGSVVAIDATWEMLGAARAAGRDTDGLLIMGDAARLPFVTRCFDAVFAGAVLHHLPGPDHGLDELARITRPNGALAIFHPIGRAALAARRGASLTGDELLAPSNLERCLGRNGWTLHSLDDGADRYLALARRGAG